MELSTPTMETLFAQLGLLNDPQSIAQFIAWRSPLESSVQLHEAAFWSLTQSVFLRDALNQDANWAVMVDALNSALHTARGETHA